MQTVLLKLQENGGGWFLPTPWGGKARGKWWGVNFRQTLYALFVFFPNSPKNQSLSSILTRQQHLYAIADLQKKRKEKKIQCNYPLPRPPTPIPIKTELNKSLSSNHSHMNTCVAVIHNQSHFCPTCTDIISNQCCVIQKMFSFFSLCSRSQLIRTTCTVHLHVQITDHRCSLLLPGTETLRETFSSSRWKLVLHLFNHWTWEKAAEEKGVKTELYRCCWIASGTLSVGCVHTCAPSCRPQVSQKRRKCSLYEGQDWGCLGYVRRKRGIPLVGQIFTSPSHWSVSDRSFVFH